MIRRSTGAIRYAICNRLMLLLLLGWPPIADAAEAGGLRIVSQPGVEVTWEGVVLGQTDEVGALDISGIPPGTYSVSLLKEGYEKLSVPLVVRPGTTTISLRLKRLPPPPEPARKPRVEAEPVTRKPAAESTTAPTAAEPQPEAAPKDVATPPPSNDEGKAVTALPLADSREGGLGLALTALLVALAGATALWLFLHSRRAVADRGRQGTPADPATAARPEGSPATETTASKALLEDLQRREMALDGSQPPGKLRERGEVIEVKDFKVIEDDS